MSNRPNFNCCLRRVVAVTLVFAISLATCLPGSMADDKRKGHRGNKHGRHYHGGGGHNFLEISPLGITYGYHDKNFGIQIGPLFGGHGYGHGYAPVEPVPTYLPSVPHYVEPPVYAQPVDPPVYNSPPNATPPTAPTPNPVIDPTANLIPTNDRARKFQQDAERAFAQHKYGEALRLARHASVEDSQNGYIFLFGSQTAFATGQYQSAMSALEVALSQLEPEQWGYVVTNFRRLYNNDDYVTQMNRLVAYTKENPNVSYPRTLRGYHYAYLGHSAAAQKQLRKALEINPQDQVAQRLLSILDSEVPSEELPVPSPHPDAGDEASLLGPK